MEFDAEPTRQLSESGKGRRLVSAFQPRNHGLDGANLPRDLALGHVVLGALPFDLERRIAVLAPPVPIMVNAVAYTAAAAGL